MPAYVPYDPAALQTAGVAADQQYYKLSDQDFQNRDPNVLAAEKQFQSNALADQSGNTTLLPQLQNEYMRSGLAGALGSFGGGASTAGGVLAQGSGAEADVARSLGIQIDQFDQQTRQNAANSLTLDEQISPRRAFGLSGSDVANIDTANTLGQNNWNQANYATNFQVDELNWLNQAQNTQAQAQAHNEGVLANAQANGAIWNGLFSSLGSLVGAAGSAATSGAGAGMCWVAREIFRGETIGGIPTWQIFRAWMLRFASLKFLHAYVERGEVFARYLKSSPEARESLRPLFEEKVNEMLALA